LLDFFKRNSKTEIGVENTANFQIEKKDHVNMNFENKSKKDYLDEFKLRLQNENVCYNTIKTSLYELNKAFYGIEFSNPSEIDFNKIDTHIKDLKGKSRVANLKFALRKFTEFNKDFEFDEVAVDLELWKKSNRRVTRFDKPLDLLKTLRKLSAIQNQSLKIAYKLMLSSALRVSEIAALKKENIVFNDDGLYVFVEHGKGGCPRLVKLNDSKYLSEVLPEYLKYFEDNENIFYSNRHMQQNSKDLGFTCHDLRRASAQIVAKDCNSLNDIEAIDEIKKHLGHSKKSTVYKKYLSRQVNFDNTKWKDKKHKNYRSN